MSEVQGPDIPEVIVHRSDFDETTNINKTEESVVDDTSENTRERPKPKMRESKVTFMGDRNVLETHEESECQPSKLKKTGKPSRRWLAMEVDKLFKSNVLLTNQLKEKKAREEELTVINRRQESELSVLKMSTNRSEMESLKKKNKQLSEDVFMMKNLVVKLTKELGRSQERVRLLKRNQDDKQEECITLSEDSGLADVKRHMGHYNVTLDGSIDLMDGELGALRPLIKAYEECILEKTNLITFLQNEIENISDRTRKIVQENNELNKRLSDQRSQGEVTYGEYVHLQKELSLVVEQNQLLLRQAKLNQAKVSDLRQAFQESLTESTLERDCTLSELQQAKAELLMLKGRFSLLQDEYRGVKEEADHKVPLSVHNASINECKRLLEELKLKYDEERESLMRRLAVLETNRPDIESKLDALYSERDRLLGQIDILQQSTKKMETRCADVEDKLVKAEKTKENLKTQLTSAVAFSGELIREQERLVKQLMEKAEEAKIGATLCKRLHALKIQVKGVEMEALEQIGLLDNNLKNQVDYVGKIKENYSKEIQRLREDIANKQAAITKLADQNKKTQEELDVVWKAATAPEKKS